MAIYLERAAVTEMQALTTSLLRADQLPRQTSETFPTRAMEAL